MDTTIGTKTPCTQETEGITLKANIRKRLADIESLTTDWAADLDIVDYIGLTDYSDGTWGELYIDGTITVMRNKKTQEVRGVYCDRRTDEEIIAIGGNPAYR